MSEEFSVGEVAIYWCPGDKFHLSEVTVLSPLTLTERRSVVDGRMLESAYCHRITDLYPEIPGNGYWVKPIYLRKKRPPEALSSWDKVQEICGWSPKQVCKL